MARLEPLFSDGWRPIFLAAFAVAGCAGDAGRGSGVDGRQLVDAVSAAWWLTTSPFTSNDGVQAKYMHQAKAGTELPAPADAAVVVFVRPAKGVLGSKMIVDVMDGDGRFVGESLPGTHFAVVRSPGPTTFFAWDKGTAVTGTLEAGKRYWVYVDFELGLFGPGVELVALNPGDGEWPRLPRWLSESTYLIADIPSADAGLGFSEKDRAKQRRRAHEVLGDYGSKQPRHTLAAAP